MTTDVIEQPQKRARKRKRGRQLDPVTLNSPASCRGLSQKVVNAIEFMVGDGLPRKEPATAACLAEDTSIAHSGIPRSGTSTNRKWTRCERLSTPTTYTPASRSATTRGSPARPGSRLRSISTVTPAASMSMSASAGRCRMRKLACSDIEWQSGCRPRGMRSRIWTVIRCFGEGKSWD